MSSRSTLDLYKALELDASATAEAITASYRRLARDCHPDKNPDNAEATSQMQKINAAYEVLKDPDCRAEYDRSMPSPAAHDDNNNTPYQWSPFDFEFDTARHHYPEGYAQARRRTTSPSDSEWSENWDQLRESVKQAIAEALRKEAESRERMREERIKREAGRKEAERQEAERQEAEEKARVESTGRAELQKLRLRKEKEDQDQIWAEAGATTAAEKRKSCLHAEFWPRQQMKAKFPCMACGQKRGPEGYKCPYCSTLQCQSCLRAFQAARAASAAR